jgi:hypothetical protein
LTAEKVRCDIGETVREGKKVKYYSETYFRAKMIDGSGQLIDYFKTKEEAERAIEKENQSEMNRAHTPTRYIVCQIDRTRVFDDNGVFCCDSMITRRI